MQIDFDHLKYLKPKMFNEPSNSLFLATNYYNLLTSAYSFIQYNIHLSLLSSVTQEVSLTRYGP